LLNVVAPHINEQQNANINITKKLTIWILAKLESFLSVGDRLAKSTGHQIFKDVIHVLAQLMPQYIQ